MKAKTMKQILATTLTAVALIITMTAVTSCVNNNDGPNGGGRMVALVTYTGSETVQLSDGSTNRVSGFTYYGADNTVSTCRTTVETRLPETVVNPGQRMVIGYTFSGDNYQPYPAGTINLMSYVLVATSTVETVSHETAVGNNAEMPLYYEGSQPAISRTGNYINLEAVLQYYSQREFTIFADESTLDTAMPELYVSTVEKGDAQGVKGRTMASFDISPIWRDPSITGVKVHINNTAGDRRQEFEFRK